MFDIISFVIAIGALLVVKIPQPAVSADVKDKSTLIEDSLFGFKYIVARKGLLGLQIELLLMNFTSSICFPLLAPMILTQTGDNTVILGTVRSAFGVGGVVGGLILSAWGGPKRKIHGVLLGMALEGFGFIILGLTATPVFWSIGAFLKVLFVPIVNGCNQAIWQSKVPPEMQGRVFSARAFIALLSQPIAMAIAGPLADGFLLPGMMEDGSLTPIFRWLIGVGPGKGISLLFLFMGIFGSIFSLGGYLFSDIRKVEDLLPDHDEVKKSILT